MNFEDSKWTTLLLNSMLSVSTAGLPLGEDKLAQVVLPMPHEEEGMLEKTQQNMLKYDNYMGMIDLHLNFKKDLEVLHKYCADFCHTSFRNNERMIADVLAIISNTNIPNPSMRREFEHRSHRQLGVQQHGGGLLNFPQPLGDISPVRNSTITPIHAMSLNRSGSATMVDAEGNEILNVESSPYMTRAVTFPNPSTNLLDQLNAASSFDTPLRQSNPLSQKLQMSPSASNLFGGNGQPRDLTLPLPNYFNNVHNQNNNLVGSSYHISNLQNGGNNNNNNNNSSSSSNNNNNNNANSQYSLLNSFYKANLKNDQKMRKKGSTFPKEAIAVLKKWLIANLDNPYPCEQSKQELANETGLCKSQISNWFINARRRYIKGLRMKQEEKKGYDHSGHDENSHHGMYHKYGDQYLDSDEAIEVLESSSLNPPSKKQRLEYSPPSPSLLSHIPPPKDMK